MRSCKLVMAVMMLALLSCQQHQADDHTVVAIIPQPNQMTTSTGHLYITRDLEISSPKTFESTTCLMQSIFSKQTQNQTGTTKVAIIEDNRISKEGYELDINDEGIKIAASSEQGAFYALQSILQLLPIDKNETLTLPFVSIKDEPRFSYRGMHLDVGRHMFPVVFIKQYIDYIAMLKMNTFHWHLTEDQGWRIEIKKYPKLQEVAAYRDQTLVGHYSDQPHQFDKKPYGGYYTQEEVKEVVAYAASKHVTVIPEIELPGHSQAALTAYPHLGCTGGPYEVAQKWGVFEDIYCTKESTFAFLEDVLDEVVALFPSTYIHIGGDEAPKTNWKKCRHCQNQIKSEGLKDEHQLQNYFVSRIEKYLNGKGRQIIGWDEILEGGLAPNATVMSWRGTNGAIEAAKMHHNVIMTPTSHCYFDYYQSEDEKEPLAIGGYLPLKKVYSFEPIPEVLTAEEARYVLGAQGNVWTEYMPTTDQVEYMIFPRILAMSEVGWTEPKKKKYEDFVRRVVRFNQYLKSQNINHADHLNEVGGIIDTIENKIITYRLTSENPNGTIRYTLDGSDPSPTSNSYKAPLNIKSSTTIKAQSYRGDQSISPLFEQTINTHKALGAKIEINVDPHKAYAANGLRSLVNGISAHNYRFGDKEWLGFWGDDLEIKIDLGEELEVSKVATRFYNSPGSWIYHPGGIEVKLENDEEWTIGFAEVKGERTVHATTQFENQKTRYIQIKIPSRGMIPEGQDGAGHKAWTFLDEITVE